MGYFQYKWREVEILSTVWKIVNIVIGSVNKYWHVTKHAVPVQVNDLTSLSTELCISIVLQLVA